MSECRLYLITPPVLPDLDRFAGTLEQALSAGDVGALQLRLKDAPDDVVRAAVQALRPVAHRHDVALILNDRPDLARELNCDGVHVGQDDAPCKDARRIMGDERTVGVTCHDSPHLAITAAEDGADYVAFGAFFPTTTKDTTHRPDPDLLHWWSEMMVVPCVAIGGITIANCAPLIAAGADFLAVSGGVWAHPEGPAAAVAAFNKMMEG